MNHIGDPAQVGPLLADLRLMNRLSQRAAAAEIGTTQAEISDWERRHQVPRVASLIRALRAYGYQLAVVPLDTQEDVRPTLDPSPSPEVVASVLAIVDAPYRPGLDVRFADDDLQETYPGSGIWE